MSRQAWIRATLFVIFTVGALLQGYFEDWALHAMAAALFAFAAIVYWLSPVKTLNGLHFALLLFVLIYGLSVVNAVDTERAIIEAVRASIWLPLGCLLLMLDRENNQRLQVYLSRIAAAIVIIGMLFAMERNDRLESTIGYANALAIMLLVALCISMNNYIHSIRRMELVVSTVIVAGLLLTMSRSVWVLWLLSAIAMLFLFPTLRRKSNIFAAGLVHLAGWFIAVLYKGNILFLLDRAKTIEPGASEFQLRLVYWRDGWRMFQDYWFLGSGGGGWRLLQSEYQSSREYYVKFIHNHYMQLMLDTGATGLIAFALLIVMFGFSLRYLIVHGNTNDRNEAKIVGLTVALLLLHAGFDFDLTFPLLAAMLLVLLMSFVSNNNNMKSCRVPRGIAYLPPILFVCLALFTAWLSVGYAEQQYASDLREDGNLFAAEAHYRIASSMIPWSHTTHYEWAKLYVLIGNQSNDKAKYQLAYKEVKKAIQIQPVDRLYSDLMADLDRNMK